MSLYDTPDLLLNATSPERRAEMIRRIDWLAPAAVGDVQRAIGACPRHRPTPIVELPAFAAALGIGGLCVKDERDRFGLGSFKALGGAYAVMALAAQALSAKTGRAVSLTDLLRDRTLARSLTFSAATAGNHGRAVAAGAASIGARCMIFVYAGVPADQVAAIAALGATIVHVEGAYDDAVDRCRQATADEGWIQVADTSEDPGEPAPRLVMQGYTQIVSEIVGDLPAPPTHVMLQAGVGGMAAALAGGLSHAYGADTPRYLVVEPTAAPCLLESTRRGSETEIVNRRRTTMGRLECYRPSATAWPILDALATAFLTVTDGDAAIAMKDLKRVGLPTSPSGAAGYAGLKVLAASRRMAQAVAFDAQSHVLVIVTERPTDADLKLLERLAFRAL